MVKQFGPTVAPSSVGWIPLGIPHPDGGKDEGGVVATRVGVSPGRVSQVRLELEASWATFQTDTAV
jgi:hypothetical protein